MRSLKAWVKKVFKPKDEDPSNTSQVASGSASRAELNSSERRPLVRDTHDLQDLQGPEAGVKQHASTYAPSQKLWNGAFDSLGADEVTADLVKQYFRVLIRALDAKSEAPSTSSPEDDIWVKLQDPEERQKYVRQLVEEGRERITTTSKVVEGLSNVIGYIENVKSLIGAAIASVPQAALPWAGVCISLQILSNPETATKSNLTGIVYVTSRMDWYCALFDHLLGNHMSAESLEPLTRQLEKVVATLYKALLLYQIKSACYYYRSRGVIFLRGLANWDDWDGDLQQVKDAEAVVETMTAQHYQEYEKSILHQTLLNGIEREKRLGEIHQDLQVLVTQQLKIWSDTKNESA